MIRYLIRLIALGLALALAWAGAATPSDETWRLMLAGAGVALLVALWPKKRGAEESPLGHNARLLGALLLTGTLLVGLQLLRLQFTQAPEIQGRVAKAGDETVHDGRPTIAGRRTRRGRIYDRHGTVLADIEVTPANWVRRTYPRGDLGHILGFYNPTYGNAGLEATYDRYLAGQVGVDPWTTFIEELAHRPHQGYDLHLTLDLHLQDAAQAAYEQVSQQMLGEECPLIECPGAEPQRQCPGAVVLLDARTGAILAMVAYPRCDLRPMVFDPAAPDWSAEEKRIALYWQGLISTTGDVLVNRATAGLYPPGSTFKTVTAAAAVESGLIRPDTIVKCPDTYTVTGHVIVNWLPKLSQSMKRQDVLEDYIYSCNTAFAQIGLMLGAERYSDYARRFGLAYRGQLLTAEPDLTDVPAAICTIARDRPFLDRPTALADTAYGQGELQVTPLYMAMVAATIANDGNMMRPYLVERVQGPAGQVFYQAQTDIPLRIPIGRETARIVRGMMVAVVEHGSGRWWQRIEGVMAGGKTGSAETGVGKTHAWFIALAPADDPRYAVAVIVEHAGHGSEVAAPIARMVLEAALK